MPGPNLEPVAGANLEPVERSSSGPVERSSPEPAERSSDSDEEIPGVILRQDDFSAGLEPFLLLPGDGLILVRGLDPQSDPIDQTGLEILYADREAHARLGEGLSAAIGGALLPFWPALAEAIQQHAPAVTHQGPRDLWLPWQDTSLLVRLFHTDDGVGVGLLAVEDGFAGPDLLHAQRGMEAMVRQRVELFERLLHAVGDVVLVTTAEPFAAPGPVILYANAALLSQTGYSYREVLGRSPRMFQGAETDAKVLAGMRKALESWRSFNAELFNYRKDGSTYWVDIAISPLRDASGWFTHWVSVQRDVTSRHHNLERLHNQAYQDPLTALPNRRSLGNHLQTAIDRLHGGSAQAVVMFCDLNRFKEVNDTYGHTIGDRLLVAITKRLQDALRPNDVLVRFAGDEFVVLLEHCGSRQQALSMAHRLQEQVGQPLQIDGTVLKPCISIGIAMSSDPLTAAADLLHRADLAMYHAKRQEGGSVAFYDPSLEG
ncbi:diguanylate cyclase domain-containing protein [Synechococcus sp. CS-1328]|uniref:diguanylate cyclase domain-containing protein n=1 Tax=Synechococcus sp. CS-1328 TaxID=2847976 RepID=UPI00223B195D|nr:diguanylate cyclase [Synechococcus sp. CS-1328]MCT0226554.1 diguanylate cyclase [Synechococcus sp. CS-1328]